MSDLDPEFQALVRKQYAGNPKAMTELGARLVVGREAPQSPVNGAALLAEAAEQGDPEAWTYIAVLAAAGAGREQSWSDALSALRHAADLAEPGAATQVRLLEATGIADSDRIDAWIAGAAARELSPAPRIRACADFLTGPLCAHVIARAVPKLKRAQVNDYHTGKLKVDSMRTNTGSVFSLIETDFVFQLVRARIAHTAGLAAGNLEPLEVLHYSVGERFKPHIDFYHPDLPNFAEAIRTKGQRVQTCLVYLNDDYEGGETDFPKIGLKFRGRAGEAIFFDNVDAEGNGDMRTLHEGMPPSRGEKWLLSQWMRDRPQPVT
jgi:prolyl 4-hydroxylase